MRRFQRVKYLAAVVQLKRELMDWEHVYESELDNADLSLSDRRRELLEARVDLVQDLVDKLEDLEGALADYEDPE